MLSFGEGEETFFDTTDQLVFEESVVLRENPDYDIWLREPRSVGERRKDFLSKMGFSECSISAEIERVDELSEGINDSLLSERRKSNSEANCSIDYSARDWLDEMSLDMEEEEMNEKLASVEQCVTISKRKKNVMSWWRSFSWKMKKDHVPNASKKSELVGEAGKMTRMRMEQSRKRCVECSAVYAGQVVQAHDGLIWTMKFSPDGQYLASGGADGVVCIWRLTTVDASCKAEECCYGIPQDNKSSHVSVIIPDRMFHIEEAPLQRLKGHRADVLDLAWSTSNVSCCLTDLLLLFCEILFVSKWDFWLQDLLSSSMDKTIRLWRADSDECLAVFHHSNYGKDSSLLSIF